MKMVLATPLYPPQSGGPATYARILEEELPTHGIEVTVVKFGDVLFLPPLIRHLVYFCLLLVRGFRAQVLFVQDTVSAGLPAALASRVLGIPLVLRVPGDFAWEQGVQRYQVTDGLDEFQRKTYGASVERLRSIQKFVARSAHTIIVPSKYFKNIVDGWGATAPVVTIYHGVLPLPTSVMPVEHHYSRVAVSVGRLVPWKGFDIVIQAMTRCPQWHLVIIGGGPDEHRLKEIIARHSLQERVHMLGEQPRTMVLGWCLSADAFVLNSSFESFSFQTVEAMALGAPIIATGIGSIPELLTDSHEGVLIAPNDMEAIVAGLKDIESHPDVWEARRVRAKEKARQFTRARMIEETVALLKAI